MCNTELTGRQTKYCSNKCKGRCTNNLHQSYKSQKARGAKRKKMLVEALGGRCQKCGYDKNYAVLSFHHKRPKNKRMKLTSREIANNKLELLYKEVKKCMLLCANCHLELHHPDYAVDQEWDDF